MTKFIAFYLPQFHPIKENDMWWGKGFTEWSNVKKALPLFRGHYQPHIPLHHNYYKLDNSQTQLQQVKLAKQFSVSGFCFYFYWFNGKTLLETPTRNWLSNKNLDFPFCLCWANENWTRRWDGLDNDILIGQNHSPQDDREFINYISPYLKDKRYIKINNKPLIILYRPNLLSAKFTAKQWRYECMMNGVGEIHLSYVQGFEKVDPSIHGFDSAIELPPLNIKAKNISKSLTLLDKREISNLNVIDYGNYLEFSENYPEIEYLLFRGVMPSWDNTARRMDNGASVVHNSSPDKFHKWLINARNWSQRQSSIRGNNDLDIVFVNAWNEWGEGCHLEPDMKYEFQWLEALQQACS